MTIIQGRTCEEGVIVEVERDGLIYPLSPRLGWANHSPTGFAWGYLGSGPAQLALAILGEVLGEQRRDWIMEGMRYQRFKEQVVAQLSDSWELTDADVRDFMAFEMARTADQLLGEPA